MLLCKAKEGEIQIYDCFLTFKTDCINEAFHSNFVHVRPSKVTQASEATFELV